MSNWMKRLPVLFISIGLGFLLIAFGLALQSRQMQTAAVGEAQSPTADVTDAPTSTPTEASTPTITPTPTPGPTPTPTATETPGPTPVPPRNPEFRNWSEPSTEQQTAIPPAAARVPKPDGVTNVLLLGTDQRPDEDPYFYTDTIMLVSINTQENTANMLSIPRDVLVYAPTWGMWKINQVYSYGERSGWEGGGFGYMAATLEYNYGVQVDYYALVDLTGMRDIVDALGGVEMAVDCEVSGPALAEPRKHPDDFETFEEWADYTDPSINPDNWNDDFSIGVGMHELDGYESLWYVRQRKGSSDFDRAYRQQQLLRAIFGAARQQGVTELAQLPGWYRQYNDLVQTNMGLGNLLEFAPIAANIDQVAINSYTLLPYVHIHWWADPKLQQTAYIPIDGAIQQIFTFAMQPPSKNYIISNTATVQVLNGTSLDRLDEVAADVLLNKGDLDTTPTGPAETRDITETVIYDFTGDTRGENLQRLQELLRVGGDNVITQPDPNREYDYRVVLGTDYQSCQDRIVR